MDGAGTSRYGDPGAVRALAAGLRDRAGDVRDEAARLRALVDACPWTGWAADAMRQRAAATLGGLHRTADRHDEAAEALDRHAAEVERRQAQVAAVERAFHALVEAVRSRVDGLVGGVADSWLEGWLRRVVVPPAGHRDWLDVDVPQLPGWPR